MTAHKFAESTADTPGSLSMFGPDFAFSFDSYATHAARLRKNPRAAYGPEVAIVGAGIAGILAGYGCCSTDANPSPFAQPACSLAARWRRMKLARSPHLGTVAASFPAPR